MESNNYIVGRTKELELLQAALNSNQAELIAVYGRRRVGKTFLISTYFMDKGIYFEFTGIKDANRKTHLKRFTKILSSTLLDDKIQPTPSDWFEALDLLYEQIKLISKDNKVIIFFDELPWIASAKSNFLQALDHFWNRYFSRMNNIILIVCGSAASWMIDNIISNTGGLYGRLTRKMHLMPFTLSETESFLNSRNIKLDKKQIIELYMAMGGIPKYLLQAETGKSSTQIINQQFFTTTGFLSKEFNNLYSFLFNKYEQHVKIVKILAKNKSGLTRKDLLEQAEIVTGGAATKVLRELEDSGFIMHLDCYPDNTKLAKYRLIDQYSLFYLRWVESTEKLRHTNSLENYWIEQSNTISWIVWCGYAFENICLTHMDKIQNALGLGGIRVQSHIWYFKGTSERPGSQIDLVLDRADNCINLCEIKFYNSEFQLTKKYGEELNKKREIFREQTKCKKSLFTTLITTYGASDNIYANTYIQSQVTMDSLFV
jgi:uncharacterized protein